MCARNETNVTFASNGGSKPPPYDRYEKFINTVRAVYFSNGYKLKFI